MESYSNGGRLWLIMAWLNGEIPLSEHLAKVVYSCTSCKNCVEKCPLSFNGDIVNMGGRFNVLHYTQLFDDLIKAGKLKGPDKPAGRITFHDPCFLGRWNGEYNAPRKAIRALKGADFTEMERNKKGALCGGGGAGNFFTDFLGGKR